MEKIKSKHDYFLNALKVETSVIENISTNEHFFCVKIKTANNAEDILLIIRLSVEDAEKSAEELVLQEFSNVEQG